MKLEEIKQYLRVTHNYDDELIAELIEEAKMYIKNVTGVEYNPNDIQYRQCIRFLVQQRYDIREAMSEKTITECYYTITNLLYHISLRGENNNAKS